MDNEGKGILSDPQATGEQVRQAWEQATLAAMEDHRKSGVPVVTWDWETGKVVLTPAEELAILEEHALSSASLPEQKS